MRLHRLTLRNVRGVEDRTLTLSPDGATTGVVIVEGRNEAGKSTLGDALDALLHSKDSSKTKDIKSLQSAGVDEGPEIEAELQIGAHRFVYQKRFLKRMSTELRPITPPGPSLTGEEAHAHVDQLLGQELDVSLWSSLRLRQGSGIEQTGPGGTQGLAAAVAGQADASAIGDRELAILGRVQEEYERYHTTKTGADKPLLRDADALVAERTEELNALDARLAELAEDVARADRIGRSLDGLRAQVVESADRADALATAKAEVEQLEQRVAECERAESTATAGLTHATERRDRRTALVRELADLETEQADVATALADAEALQRSAAERLEAAKSAHDAAQAARRDAAARREEAQRDLDLLRDRQALSDLRGRDGRIATAAAQLREAQEVLRRSAVDEAVLTQLRDAQTEVVRSRAALEAASPELRFTAAADVAIVADGTTDDLTAGDSRRWAVDGALTLRIGDVGELQVTAGAGITDAAQDHRSAVAALEEALTRVEVADVEAAEVALRQRGEAARQADDARGARDRALDGTTADALTEDIEQLERSVAAALDRRPDDAPLPDDVAAARVALEEASRAERLAEDAVAGPARDVDQATADQAGHREAEVTHRARSEGNERRLAALRADLDAARAAHADADLDSAVSAADETCTQARSALSDARAALADADPDTVTKLAENAMAVADDARDRLHDAEGDLRDTRVRIGTRGGDGLYEQREDVAAALLHATTARDGLRRRAAAATLLLQRLEEQRALARDRYAAPLRHQLLAYGRVLYGPEFDIELDDDLRVSRRLLESLWLEVGQLSIGAQEQLALLGRLACATLLGEKGGLLLFDDALGNTDPERLARIGAVLRQAGEHCQVIVLTCYPDRYRHVGGAHRLEL